MKLIKVLFFFLWQTCPLILCICFNRLAPLDR